MKKVFALVLVFVLLVSLCACGQDDTQATDPSSSSQITTGSTESSTSNTESSTETTQTPTQESTTSPATEAPTTPPTTQPAACSHSWKDATCTTPKTCAQCGATEGGAAGHSWSNATCTAPKTCTKCGATEGSAAGHNYQNGTCTGCGDVEIITHAFGTGAGYAVTLSSDGTEISCYQISVSELLYINYTTEKPATGYYVFREYNGTTYYAPAPSWGWGSVNSYTISGRTVQIVSEFETLELELISANQYKVTKGTESIPEGLVFTFGVDMCSFMGHLYERSCENDVTCMYCSHFKCAGLGHEYGEDDIGFRCVSAMRPSDS